MSDLEQRNAQLRQSPDLVLVHREDQLRVHFGQVGDRFVWQSYEARGEQLGAPSGRYAGMAFIESPKEAERLFRRLAACNGFTEEPE